MIPLSVVTTAHDAGLCVVPPAQDGSKRPLPPGSDPRWKQYTAQRPDLTLLHRWYDPQNGLTGMGIVTGKVSGNLECIDFDTLDGWEAYQEMADHCGILPLLDRVWAGYGEFSPRGAHLLYRCATVAGNTKLARNAAGKAFIETRGEGGYLVIAPSNGTVHPSGSDYRCVSGSLATIADISVAERKDLWELARSLDQVPRQPDQQADPFLSSSDPSNRPGEDFNRRTSWSEILEPRGWRKLFTRNDVTYWRRPGKDSGVSATTGYAGTDYLYVFTSSTPLDNERAYTRFGVYALLDHGGDFRAATTALGKAGYGEQPRKPNRDRTTESRVPPAGNHNSGEATDSVHHERSATRPPLIPMADYIAKPRASSYLIKGVLPARGLAQLFGDSNVGKSFLAIDMGCHIASGMTWRGFKTKRTGVVYVAAEGLNGLTARLAAWAQQFGEIPDRFWIREWPVGLTVPGAGALVAEDILALPFPVGLVILDTFAGNFGVGSENDAEDMAAALLGMKMLGHERLVINIHHTGHQDKQRSRGHSSLFAAIDVELMVAKPGDGETISLSHTKVRDGERIKPLGFRLERADLPWADEDGDPINSAVLLPADAPEMESAKPVIGRKQSEALQLLRDLYAQRKTNLGESGIPRVSLRDWYTAMESIESDKGHRSRIRATLEKSGFVRTDNGFVYVCN